MAMPREPKKTKPKRDEEREERISMEIIVDAHDEEERAMGWYWADENLGLHKLRAHPGFVARFSPPCEQRFFRPCFFAFQMACSCHLSVATDTVSNKLWRYWILQS